MTRVVSVAIAAILTVSCAPALVKLPSGPTTPLAAEAFAGLASRCGTRPPTMTAEISARGSVAGQRVRARLLVGLSGALGPQRIPAAVRFEAMSPFGPPVFIFVAQAADATLLLPRADRYLEHARPEKVLDALVGVPLTTSDLVQVLTLCYDLEGSQGVRTSDDSWVIVRSHEFDVYYHRETSSRPYRIVAATHRCSTGVDWRVEYRNYQDDRPLVIRLTSLESGCQGGSSFDLTLSLSQIGTERIERDAFRIEIPQSAQPITIDELRDARPGLRKD